MRLQRICRNDGFGRSVKVTIRIRERDRVQLLDLLPYVTLPEGNVNHRRLDVGVSHRLHDGEGVCRALQIYL